MTIEQFESVYSGLNEHAEKAAEHLLEAGYYWLVIFGFAKAGEFYGERVWTLLDQHYPGGQAAFRADPLGATDTGPNPKGAS